MKVLIWTNTFPKYSETFIRDHIIGLKKKGIKVYIYNSQKKNLDEVGSLQGFEDFNLLDDIVYKTSFIPQAKWFRKIKAIYILLISLFNQNFRILKNSLNREIFNNDAKSFHLFYFSYFILKNKIDIIHAHFGTNGQLATKFKKINLPIKLITTFHGFDIRLGLQKPNDFYKDLFNCADTIIAISNYNKDKLISFGANPIKIKLIPNGIDLDFFKVEKIIKNSTIKFLTVARLVEEKDIRTAVLAFDLFLKENPNMDISYSIIGEGHLRPNIEKLINDLELSMYIQILGAKNSEEVCRAMVSSDVFILSSVEEILPTVLLEAQACEMQIIATDIGSVREIVPNGVVIPKGEIQSLADGISKLLQTRENWAVIGKLNRAFIKENFNSNDTIKKIIRLYEN